MGMNFAFAADTATLIDASLSEEKKLLARETVSKILGTVSELHFECLMDDAVISKKEVLYSGGELSSAARETFASLSAPHVDGKKRRILFVFHGSDGSVSDEAAAVIEQLYLMGGHPMGYTRIFVFSESEELAARLSRVGGPVWSISEEELTREELVTDIAHIIYHAF